MRLSRYERGWPTAATTDGDRRRPRVGQRGGGPGYVLGAERDVVQPFAVGGDELSDRALVVEWLDELDKDAAGVEIRKPDPWLSITSLLTTSSPSLPAKYSRAASVSATATATWSRRRKGFIHRTFRKDAELVVDELMHGGRLGIVQSHDARALSPRAAARPRSRRR